LKMIKQKQIERDKKEICKIDSKLDQKNTKLYIVERDENEEYKDAGNQKSNKI